MTSRTGQIIRMWATCKPQKTSPARTHWSMTILSRKMAAHEGAFMLLLRDSQEDREFYQAKTVNTHSNNLVVLAHVQFLPFYRLSTRDVTHVRKCTRPSPALPYCKRQEAGRGPGKETTHPHRLFQTVLSQGSPQGRSGRTN